MKLYIQMYILSVRHLGFSNIFSDNNIPLSGKIGYSKSLFG